MLIPIEWKEEEEKELYFIADIILAMFFSNQNLLHILQAACSEMSSSKCTKEFLSLRVPLFLVTCAGGHALPSFPPFSISCHVTLVLLFVHCILSCLLSCMVPIINFHYRSCPMLQYQAASIFSLGCFPSFTLQLSCYDVFQWTSIQFVFTRCELSTSGLSNPCFFFLVAFFQDVIITSVCPRYYQKSSIL